MVLKTYFYDLSQLQRVRKKARNGDLQAANNKIEELGAMVRSKWVAKICDFIDLHHHYLIKKFDEAQKDEDFLNKQGIPTFSFEDSDSDMDEESDEWI